MRGILEHPTHVLDIMRDVAEAEIMSRFRDLTDADISEKAPGDLVTVADHESERAFAQHLPSLIPGSRIVGEEGYEANPDTLLSLADDDPVWIVDPVDGTFNFAHGKSPFTVIVALVHHRETKAGWILDPLTGEAVFAIEGIGAFGVDGKGGTPVQLARHSVAFSDTKLTAGMKLRKRFERAVSELDNMTLPTIVERYRCVGREYMDIALGTLDHARYGSKLKPWDHAAGCLIVRECGGRADLIDDETPYQATPNISRRTVGVTGNSDHWDTWRSLVQQADRYL